MSSSKFRPHIIFSLALLCALLNTNVQACLASSKDSGKPAVEWTLTQTVRDAGLHTVKVAHDAVRIECKDQNFVVISKAPDWHVDCFRPKEKRWWRGDMSNFTGVLLINPFAVPTFNVLTMQKLPRKIQYAGMTCTQYIPITHPNYVQVGADDIDTSQRVAEMLCRYFIVAKIDQVPLTRRYFNKDSGQKFIKAQTFADYNFMKDLRERPQLTLTTSAINKGPYVASDFELPKGLNRVKEISLVGLSDEHKTGFSDIMEEFGNTSGIDKKSTDKKANAHKQ